MSEWKLLAVVGAIAAALGGVAMAEEVRIRIDRDGPGPFERVGEADTDHDGYLSRAEATAQAERIFDSLDFKKEGKIPAQPFDRFERRDDREDREEGRGEHREIRREVFIIRDVDRDEDDEHEDGPRELRMPRPPRPPIPAMLFLSNEEADLNGDGVLSKQEFVAQQLRFFDAADANRDGKVKLPPRPPRPPAPPEAPDAPKPPRR